MDIVPSFALPVTRDISQPRQETGDANHILQLDPQRAHQHAEEGKALGLSKQTKGQDDLFLLAVV